MAKQFKTRRASAFTLVEVMVAIVVLLLLVAMIGQLFNNATVVSAISTSHLEADARVQVLFTRMAADFSHMVKRKDVDYFLKPTLNGANPTSVNDQMAFYSEVSGYSTGGAAQSSDAQNSVSLIAYRLNTAGTAPFLERLGEALYWSGDTSVSANASAGLNPVLPVAFSPITIASCWPAATRVPATTATSDAAYDSNFEIIVPNAFRFEYYYLLGDGTLSAVPYTNAVAHTTVSGLQDVVGIGVVVAVTDRKSTSLAFNSSTSYSGSALQTLASNMVDFSSTLNVNGQPITVGGLKLLWQNQAAVSSLAPAIKNGIRVYERVFPIKTQ